MLIHAAQHQQRLFCRAFRTYTPVEYIAESLVTLAHGADPTLQSKKSAVRLVSKGDLSLIRSPPLRFTKPVSPLWTCRTLITVPGTTLSEPPLEVTLENESGPHSSLIGTRHILPIRTPERVLGKPWTQEEDKRMVDLKQSGLGWRKVAAMLGRKHVSCVSRYYRFLDPSLADAVEDIFDTDEDKEERDGSSTRLESDPRLWTLRDRELLESLVLAKKPWFVIAGILQRNQESCREKWFRIRRAKIEAKRRSKRVQSDRWNRLIQRGFTPHHRDLLVMAIDTQLRTKKGFISSLSPADPLGLLEMGIREQDSGNLDMTMAGEVTHQRGHDVDGTTISDIGHIYDDAGVYSARVGSGAIDWNAIAQALNGKFSAEQLKSIYHGMAEAKLLWTPEEDDRLIRAVVRLGPPEFQPRLWTMIKEAFGDDIRSSEEYQDRWRHLDMPRLGRDWDHSEKTKFWRRWIEFHRDGSLLSLPAFSKKPTTGHDQSSEATTTTTASSTTLSIPSLENSTAIMMWDTIAEGLEYRHGEDCQLYFEQTTARFPRDPKKFDYLVEQYANFFLEPRRKHWTMEAARILEVTVESYLQANMMVPWKSVSEVLDSRYTPRQCLAKWKYLSQLQAIESEHGPEDPFPEPTSDQKDQIVYQDQSLDDPVEGTTHDEPDASKKTRLEYRLWSDHELDLLQKGVQEYGRSWTKIQKTYLPHRAVQSIHERYWRSQAKRKGRFTERERALLENVMEVYGGDADWNLVASHVPGRTAHQCRMAWNYGRTHHVAKQDEPWTDLDRERLKGAVERFGSKWTVISEFVVGKTPIQCRKEWEEKLDPAVNRAPWTNAELDRLMERVETLMSQGEPEIGMTDNGDENTANWTKAFVDPTPLYNGKRRVDWREVAKEMQGRTPQQCRIRFKNHRKLYRIEGDF
ncbi:hypothetical protein BGX31_010054 [Mortierella sp. GBA43]|nr:hypothetical protein BGX31_010054 [Mortierella sp. GBA43]